MKAANFTDCNWIFWDILPVTFSDTVPSEGLLLVDAYNSVVIHSNLFETLCLHRYLKALAVRINIGPRIYTFNSSPSTHIYLGCLLSHST